MTIKIILAPVSGSDHDTVTLATAFLIAHDFDAHVDVLFARRPPSDAVPMVGEGVSATMVEQLMESAAQEWERRESDARRAFEAAVHGFGVSKHDVSPGPGTVTAAWRVADGREDEVVTRASQLSDLLVLGNEPAGSSDAQLTVTLESALFRGGRPLLLAPATPPREIGRAVAIAWNGSVEVARAVAGALPLLHRATDVHILTAATRKTDPSVAGPLADYLAWHGILATPRRLDPGGDPVGGVLLAAASDLGADLMVMGGYSHSRLRELILGGVTRFVLAQAGIPILMSH